MSICCHVTHYECKCDTHQTAEEATLHQESAPHHACNQWARVLGGHRLPEGSHLATRTPGPNHPTFNAKKYTQSLNEAQQEYPGKGLRSLDIYHNFTFNNVMDHIITPRAHAQQGVMWCLYIVFVYKSTLFGIKLLSPKILTFRGLF